MASIKIHAILGDTQDWGDEACDFRNMADDVFPGETHRTIFEKDFGPEVETNEAIELVLEDGPEWNRITQGLFDVGLEAAGAIGTALGITGQAVKLRLGVWDK